MDCVDELVTSQQPTVRDRSEDVDRRVLQTRFHEASLSHCRVSATHLPLPRSQQQIVGHPFEPLSYLPRASPVNPKPGLTP